MIKMDKTILERLELDSYCMVCEHMCETNGCDGCHGIIDIYNSKNNKPPSKFKMKKKYEKQEEKKMIVTIIGSYSNTNKMKECKEYWERFGHKVNCPCDPGREDMSLIEKQSSWIEKIEEADLVVSIPKEIKMQGHGASAYVHEFGESTSYEMAIALRFKKPIVIW